MTNSGDSSGCGGWRLRIKEITNVQGRWTDGARRMDGTSYAIYAILGLEVVALLWTLLLVKISSERIETRISNLKIELLEWLLEESQGIVSNQEPPTPFTMAMPFLQDWLDRTLNPVASAEIAPARSTGGKFASLKDLAN